MLRLGVKVCELDAVWLIVLEEVELWVGENDSDWLDVGEGLVVGNWLGVCSCERVAERLGEPVGLGVHEPDGDGLGVADSVCCWLDETLIVCVSELLRLCDWLAVTVRVGDSDAVCEGVCCWLADPEAVCVCDGVALGVKACEGDAEGVGLGACEAVLEDVLDGVTVCDTVIDCVGVGEQTDLRPCTRSKLR